MNGKRILAGFVLTGLGAALFSAGAWWGDRSARRYDQWGPERLISTAIDSVRANALDALPSDELLRRAVSGMLRELRDPYAALLRPEGAREYRGLLKGDGQGVGLVIRPSENQLRIARVFPGSPAAVAGLRAGDRVISVNGVVVGEQNGGHNTPVDSTNVSPSDVSRLVLFRPLLGDTVRVTLTAGNWHVPAASGAVMLTNSTGYVALTSVSSKGAEELDDAIGTLVGHGAKAVVLDLRGNGGGMLEEGVRIASLFLPRNALVVSVTGKPNTPPLERRATRDGRWQHLPVTVLVDARTASAAEIVAAALRDHNRALLVGEPTYGKGLVQRVVALTPDLSMRMTTARWMTPSGKVLERREGTGINAHGGLMPDVFVPDAARRDPMATPPGLSELASARMLRVADTAAARALREGWSTNTLAVLERRLHASINSYLAPVNGSATARTIMLGEAARLATVRVLEITGNPEAAARYHAQSDHALRAALEIVAPGAQPMQVDAPPALRQKGAVARAAKVKVAPAPPPPDSLQQ